MGLYQTLRNQTRDTRSSPSIKIHIARKDSNVSAQIHFFKGAWTVCPRFNVLLNADRKIAERVSDREGVTGRKVLSNPPPTQGNSYMVQESCFYATGCRAYELLLFSLHEHIPAKTIISATVGLSLIPLDQSKLEHTRAVYHHSYSHTNVLCEITENEEQRGITYCY